MPTQVYSSQMVENLATAFPRRNDNSFAWGNVISCYLGLPRLRAFWPTSCADESWYLYDISGQGRTLTNHNAAIPSVYSLQSYMNFDGINQYLSRADENGIDFSINMTLFAWIRPDGVAGANLDIFSKWLVAGNQREYRLTVNAGALTAAISTNGIAGYAINSTDAPTANEWQFVAMRFIPNTELSVWRNTTKSTNAIATPASIFNSTSPLYIASYSTTSYFAGDITLMAMCGGACSDAQVNAIYWLSRPLFYGS